MSVLISRLTKGNDPIDLGTAKLFLKVDTSDDDVLIRQMLDVAIEYAQSYTGREYRSDTQWRLLLDEFADRICVQKSDVASITSIEYLVSSVWTAVATSVYYLKRNVLWPEILLADDQVWPTDLDTIEHGIRIDFTTQPHEPSVEQVKMGILRHVASMYADRGDSEPLVAGNAMGSQFPLAMFDDSARRSGAQQFYMSHRIPRY